MNKILFTKIFCDLNFVLKDLNRSECYKNIPLGRSWEHRAHHLEYGCDISSLGTPDFSDPVVWPKCFVVVVVVFDFLCLFHCCSYFTLVSFCFLFICLFVFCCFVLVFFFLFYR